MNKYNGYNWQTYIVKISRTSIGRWYKKIVNDEHIMLRLLTHRFKSFDIGRKQKRDKLLYHNNSNNLQKETGVEKTKYLNFFKTQTLNGKFVTISKE